MVHRCPAAGEEEEVERAHEKLPSSLPERLQPPEPPAGAEELSDTTERRTAGERGKLATVGREPGPERIGVAAQTRGSKVNPTSCQQLDSARSGKIRLLSLQ